MRHDHTGRRDRLRAAIRAADLDLLLITDLINLRYLTGFTGSNAALLVGADPGGDLFGTDGRYVLQAGVQVPDLPLLVDRQTAPALLAVAVGRVGFEAAAVTVAELDRWQPAAGAGRGATLVPTTDLVETLRLIKDADEIQALQAACALADRALAELIETGGLRPGRTERAVGLELDQRMRELGAHGPAFDTIVATGVNGAVPHHEPDTTVLAAGDLVTLDFGAELDGYHSDMTRTVVLGAPATWQADLYALVAVAQSAGRAACVPGATGGQVDTAARDLITAAGHGEEFVHGLGHGVGLRIHEGPAVAARSAAIIAQDMCVTVEPGIYLPGRGGVRIEDCGVVRDQADGGYQVITGTTKDLVAL